jgi:hypothetical protein
VLPAGVHSPNPESPTPHSERGKNGPGYSQAKHTFDLKEWDFFLPAALTCEEDEVMLIMDMFEEYQAMDFYNVSAAQMRAFILDVKEGYADKDSDVAKRYYHTWVHAIDVTHCVYFFLTRCGIGEHFSREDKVCLLTAALGHDYGHVGVANGYLINTRHELAIKYHNQAVQENMHADMTCYMLEKHKFLHKMNPETAEKFNKMAHGAILCTDMGGHGGLHKRIHEMKPEDIVSLSFDDKIKLMGYILHSADLSNPAKPMRISRHWEEKVINEFFAQGKLEKSRGMTVSPNCESARLNRPDLQFKFLQFVILPSYKTLNQLFPLTELCLNTALENQTRWATERDNFLNLEQQAVLRSLCADTGRRAGSVGGDQIEDAASLALSKVKKTTRWAWATKALDSDWWVGISTVLTIFALFGDDLRLCVFDISADGAFVVVSAIIFFVFFVELALTTYANIGFAFSFFFWLDFIAWLSMVTDVTPLWDGIQSLFSDDGATADFSVAKNARAARTIRIIRLIRLVRIIKLIKSVQKNRELAKLKEAAKAQKMNLTFSAKDRDVIFRRYNGEKDDQRDDGKPHLSVGVVLKAKVYKALHRDQVVTLVADAFNNYEVPPGAANNFLRKVHTNEDNMVEFSDWEEAIRRAQGEQVQLSLWEHKLNQPSQVGQELSDVTIRRVIILVLALLFVFPQLTALDTPEKEAQSYGLEVLHRYSLMEYGQENLLADSQKTDGSYEGQEWYVDYGELNPGGLRVNKWYAQEKYSDVPEEFSPLLALEIDRYKSSTAPILFKIWPYNNNDYNFNPLDEKTKEEEIRGTELVKIKCTGCDWEHVECDPEVTGTYAWDKDSLCITEAWFDDDGFAAEEGAYNIAKTCCVIAALMIGAYYFIKDAEELVIKPIERMTNLVQELAKNPLAKVSFDANSELEGETVEELPYEIQLLEDTLSKISKLVQMGFGNVGAEIVAHNLADGEFDPVQPGKRMYGLYGTCNISRFIDTTDCLQEDVTVFINILGGMIHGAVNQCGGLVSQNLGDSFLLIWKLAANSNEIHIIEAMLQPEHLKASEQVVDYFQAMVADDMAKAQAENAEKEWEPTIADNALTSFIFSTLELQTSPTLKEYRDNKKLMRKFEYPFVPTMSFGLHAGWAIQGAIGSKYKIDASFMSQDVEISTYMRTATESYGVPIIMSHVFYSLLSAKVQKLCRVLDCVKFGNVGKCPISLHTFDIACSERILLPSEGKVPFAFIEKVQANVPQDFVNTFNEGVKQYLEGNWSQCEEPFRKTQQMVQADGPSKKMLDILQNADNKTPQDWAGYRRLL